MSASAVDESLLQEIRQSLPSVRVPGAYDVVHNEECIFSTDTPFAPGGIYVSLHTFRSYSESDVRTRAGADRLFVRLKARRVKKAAAPAAAADGEAGAAPQKLALGVDGGFALDGADEETVKDAALFVLPRGALVPLPCAELPELVLQACAAVQAHSSSFAQEQVGAWEEEVKVSKYAADLPQEDGVRISADPSTWVCAESGARENLWLNLSDGHIGSGRQQALGMGGTGAALRHYEAMKAQGKHYPLVVKLGTISAHGADVYSYAPDEDDSVKDPLLPAHLARLGINAMELTKTEKTTTEMQIELNATFEFDRITEAGKALVPLSAPGCVGLANLGNTCYVNSTLQLLLSTPEAQARYARAAAAWLDSAPADDPASDLHAQLAKLAAALHSERYVRADAAEAEGSADCVQPRLFKSLIGRGHAEFGSSRQQDALEFLQYLLQKLERAERAERARVAQCVGGAADAARAGGDSLPRLFALQLEERTQCGATGAVRYVRREDNCLSLPIPLEAATNMEAVREAEAAAKKQRLDAAAAAAAAAAAGSGSAPARVQPVVPFESCVAALGADETVADFYSSAAKAKVTALKRLRIARFPRYLLVQMRRYYVGDDWAPKKLDALVAAPSALSLEHLRASGPQPNEEQLPDEEEGAAAAGGGGGGAAAVEPNEEIVAALVSMGFSENGSKRAAVATGNAPAEVCMEWVLAHMDDADFNEPLTQGAQPAAAGGGGGGGGGADPASVEMLAAMGFTAEQASVALRETSGNLERAADWLFSHADDLPAAIAAASAGADAAAGAGGTASFDDGVGEYELHGFVSHMGANLGCGHYVAHIKRGDQWVLFNDRKVAVSEAPPFDMGYLYLYRRTTPSTAPSPA